MPPSPESILVTGGAGFIGSHLVDAFLAAGWRVAALDNLSTGSRDNLPEEVPLYEVDLRDRAALFAAVQDFHPTHIAHQAAQASVSVSVKEPATDAEVNVLGGLHLLDAAREHGVRKLLFASTGGAIYGEVPAGRAAAEDWPPHPKSPYAASKFAFETYLEVYRQNYGLASTVLRYANVYGPRQNPHGEAGVVAIFTHRLAAGESVSLFARREPGDGGCVRDYIHVADVARANLLAVEEDLNGIYNVGTGEARTTHQVLEAVAGALDCRPRVEQAPPRPGDLEVSVLDAAKLQARGWAPSFSFTDGIADTVRALHPADPE